MSDQDNQESIMHPETQDSEESSNTTGTKVYKYRWIVLLIFCLCTITNFMQFLQFTIVSNKMTKYYGVSNIAVDATGLIFFVAYIVLFLPVSYLIEKYNLKVTMIVSSGLTSAGNLVKIASAQPDRFYVAMVGQSLCAVGQIYLLSIPSKFASVWFGPNEVSTACAIAVLGTQLGAAIGSVLPPLLIKGNEDSSDIGQNLYNMMIFNATASCMIFVIVLIFFKARPKLPPSQSQVLLLERVQEPPPFMKNCKDLLKNKNFLLLLLSFGLFNSLWNSFGIIINTIYTHHFPDRDSDVGIITLSAIISGGCIGSLIFGIILDKTHQFKKVSIGIMSTSTILYIVVSFCLMQEYRIGSYIAIPVFGFFAASALLISFEYTLELTYPIPESVSCSVLNAIIFLFAIIYSLVAEVLLEEIGYLWTYFISFVIFLFCTITLFFLKNDLRRREANLANENRNSFS